MSLLSLAAVLLSALAFPGAGQPYEALDAGDVFVATITRVEDKGTTNANPPKVWLEVNEVIRGETKVARSPAIWSPPFHGIDWGDGDGPELKKWNVQPLKGPKVGEKFILGGVGPRVGPDRRAPVRPDPAKEPPSYELFAFVRIPYSEEARKQAVATLAALDAEHRKYAAEVAAAAKERAERGQKWRAALTEEVIDRRTQEADAVAIATIVGSDTYLVEEMLKGQARMSTGGKYYVSLPTNGYDGRIRDLVEERPRCILFLSEKNLVSSVGVMQAQIVDPYEGIVVADAAAIAAVKGSLARRPPPQPKPLLVISALDRADAAPLAAAARASFAVVNSHDFTGHSPNTIVHIRKMFPSASFLVMIDRSPQRRVVALRIEPDSSITIYEAICPEKQMAERCLALARMLEEKAQ